MYRIYKNILHSFPGGFITGVFVLWGGGGGGGRGGGVEGCIHVINFKEAPGRFFFHFLEVFEKCIGYIRIFFIHFLEVSLQVCLCC